MPKEWEEKKCRDQCLTKKGVKVVGFVQRHVQRE